MIIIAEISIEQCCSNLGKPLEFFGYRSEIKNEIVLAFSLNLVFGTGSYACPTLELFLCFSKKKLSK
jgi:hypothetical protein